MPTTYQSLLANRPSRMGPFVIASIVGHAAIVVAVVVMSWVLEGPRIELDQKPITASLVRIGKKRDEQLLPRKDAAPPPETAKVPIPTPGVKPEPVSKKTSKDQKPDNKKSLFDALNKTAVEDPEGDENGDPNGDAAKQEGEKYYGVISSAVRRHYDVSNTIPEAERIRLSADVILRLDAEGGLVDAKLAHDSGNPVFDNAVITAIKKAAPFGPPPPHIKAMLKKDGVQLRFKP